MDMAKLVADLCDLPVLMVPTLSATCAAYAPLSVVYDLEGRTEGTVFFQREVNCVLADTALLARQPVRCACAGMMDAMAKLVEIRHYGSSVLQWPAMNMAVTVAQHVFDRLSLIAEQAMADLQKGQATPAVEEMVYLTIAGTGMVSGLAAHWNYQSAIAHCVYDAVRKHYPKASSSFLHGEIVAVGLCAQTDYTGWNAQAVRAMIQTLHMPQRLEEIGLDAAAFQTICPAVIEEMYQTGRLADKQRLMAAIQTIC